MFLLDRGKHNTSQDLKFARYNMWERKRLSSKKVGPRVPAITKDWKEARKKTEHPACTDLQIGEGTAWRLCPVLPG
jgi:hypothetical protein